MEENKLKVGDLVTFEYEKLSISQIKFVEERFPLGVGLVIEKRAQDIIVLYFNSRQTEADETHLRRLK